MNKTVKIILIIVVTIIIIFIVRACYLSYVYSSYNDIVNHEFDVKSAWSQVEGQYQRRIDIIKNISYNINKTSKNTTSQIQDLTSTVDSLSNIKMDPKDSISIQNYVIAQEIIFERAQSVLELENHLEDFKLQLEGSENRISFSLKSYNEVVTSYNSTIQKFPKSVISKMFGFTNYPMISIPQEAN